MKLVLLILIITCSLVNSATVGQCIYGNCKNGYGRLKKDKLLYCGNFTSRKLNGVVLICYYQEINGGIITYSGDGKRLTPTFWWHQRQFINFTDGQPDLTRTKYLLGQPPGGSWDNELSFSTDLRNYDRYYEGPVDDKLRPNGVGNIYTEAIGRTEAEIGKRVLVDSIMYENGIPKTAKSYHGYSVRNGGYQITDYVNLNFIALKPGWFERSDYMSYYIEAFNPPSFYNPLPDNPNKKRIASAIMIREDDSKQGYKVIGVKLYTPDGTLVYEGEANENGTPKDRTYFAKKCLSGNCENGTGKLLMNMPIATTKNWYSDGWHQSVVDCICVFQGKFEGGKPIGIFKMWNTCGYDFTGTLNPDFSLQQGKFNMSFLKSYTYQGDFAPNSEAVGGVFVGLLSYPVRLTKDRKWVKE